MSRRLKILRHVYNRADAVGQIISMVGIATVCAMLILFGSDREPPFALRAYTTNEPRPGETLRIVADVRRDLNRQCSVTYSHRMSTRDGTKFWESVPRYENSVGLSALDAATPNQLKLDVQIPEWAPVGPMMYTTSLDYVCNPIHYIWPIEVVTNVRATIKPKD